MLDEQGAWVLTETDLHLLAYGAGVLGAGGGGGTRSALLEALAELRRWVARSLDL
jgi:DUF917 family protein